MRAFQKTDQEATSVYVFNREKVAGGIDSKIWILEKEIEYFYSQLDDLMIEKQLVAKIIYTFAEAKVRGDIAIRSLILDEEDG